MKSTAAFNVLIADDHELILQAMQKLVAHLHPHLTSHLVSDWPQLAAALETGPPMDLAIVDYHMPGSSLAGFVDLSVKYPQLPVVVVSADTSPETVHALFRQASIRGFVPKTDQAAVLLQALNLVLTAGKYVPAFILSTDDAPDHTQACVSNPNCTHANPWGLSSRLQDVLILLAQGLSNKMIARQLGISDLTVKTHVNLLFKQMSVKNRAEATALFLRQKCQAPL